MSQAGFGEFLQPPRAHGGPAGRGQIRTVPEDFVVREWLGFEADGEGEHWLLTVRKRGSNTLWVAKQLARMAQISPRDVGFAGLKDRHAVTEQSFTLPVRATPTDWTGASGEGFEVVRATRHRRKLKRGALRANDFAIVVRNFSGDSQALTQRLSAIATQGVPNYFGPQRFGADAGNVARAWQWFSGAIEPQDRIQRGFALSAARAAIFNAVLAERVRQSTWQRIQSGDLANLDGSNSVFAVDAPDAVLNERCERFDIHPTGPLWGRGALRSQDQIATLEQSIAARYEVLSAGLVREGLEQERRALRIRVSQLEWSLNGAELRLGFRLPRGAFATAVLHELLEDAFSQPNPEAEEE